MQLENEIKEKKSFKWTNFCTHITLKENLLRKESYIYIIQFKMLHLEI